MVLISIFILSLPLACGKSCANLCGTFNAYSIVNGISCQCDSFCEQIGDCCQDYWAECGNKNDMKQNSYITLGNVSCQSFYLRKPQLSIRLNGGVYMVSSCPLEYEDTTEVAKDNIKKCAMGNIWPEKTFSTTNEDLSLIAPVYVNGVTFVNIFCAICNAVTGNVLYWEFYYTDLMQIFHADISLLPFPPTLFTGNLFRHPSKKDSNLYSVNGLSRLSKYCFTQFPGSCSTSSCSALVCGFTKVAECQECSPALENISHCHAHFSGTQFLHAAQPFPGKGFHYDLTFIFKDRKVRTNLVNAEVGLTQEFNNSICSHTENGSNETCFPSKLDCRQIPCTTAAQTNPEESSVGTTILTFVGLGTSLLSLILTLVICWKTESFQEKIVRLQIQCFITHIGAILSFIAAGLIGLRESADWLCQSAAILMHFSFLAMFSWMNVIAWSLFMMIRGTKLFLDEMVVQSPKWVESVAHYVFGWSIPMITVLISIVMEYVLSPGYMSYGKDSRCWINEYKGMLYLFLVSLISK